MNATNDHVLDILTSANPHPRDSTPEVSADPVAQAILASILAQPAAAHSTRHRDGGRRRRARRVLAPVLSLTVVVAVVAVVLHAGAARHPAATAREDTTVNEIVLRLHATPEVPRITRTAVTREIQILRVRLQSAGAAPTRFSRDGDTIIVHSQHIATSRIARSLLTRNPQIELTDWEQNVIAPDGRTVASLLPGGNRQAQLLSHGRAGAAGAPDAGALRLYAAVRLASQQPSRAATTAQTRRGAQFFAFAAAKSASCRTSDAPCWVSGPSATLAAASRAARGAGVAHPIVLTVPQGTIVVRATDPSQALRPGFGDPRTRYFVMRDDAALTGLDIRRMTAATDAGGQPDVDGTLTPSGARAFQALTAAVAHRGQRLARGATPAYQHFAIIINGVLATVPGIDYHDYPDGVVATSTIQIDGGFSRARAIELADALHPETLPLRTTIAPHG